MLILQAAVSLQSLLLHDAALPIAGGAFAGLVIALVRSPLRPFGIRESESLMKFSSLGSLRCICGASHPESWHQTAGSFAARAGSKL